MGNFQILGLLIWLSFTVYPLWNMCEIVLKNQKLYSLLFVDWPSACHCRVDRNKYQIQIPLPPKIDPSVTMMTVEEKPDVTYNDVGGCKEQIEKMREVHIAIFFFHIIIHSDVFLYFVRMWIYIMQRLWMTLEIGIDLYMVGMYALLIEIVS